MTLDLFLATNEGLLIAQPADNEWAVSGGGLEGRHVTSVIAREGVVLAGTEDGIFRSDDGGDNWREASNGLSVRHVRWLAYHPGISDFEIVGTEPAAIFVSQDGAQTWQECPEVAQMRRAHGWYLPYSPEAGCIRGLAIQGRRAYAAAEVGGVLRSDDGGRTWALAPGSRGDPGQGAEKGRVHADVHSVTVHPSSENLVLAPTGGGLFRSEDGGRSWERLYRCYCRAAWWDPDDPQHIIFGPADSVDLRGRIEASKDGGRTWHGVGNGVDVPWARHMVERLHALNGHLFAVLSNGQLLVSHKGELAWKPILEDAGWINDLTTMG